MRNDEKDWKHQSACGGRNEEAENKQKKQKETIGRRPRYTPRPYPYLSSIIENLEPLYNLLKVLLIRSKLISSH